MTYTFHIPSFVRDEHFILGEISLTLPKGQWLCILGRSGVGKTTLLRLIAGLEDLPSLTPSLSYMIQQDSLLPWLSVFDNVGLGFRLRQQKVPTELILKVLMQVGLAQWQDSYPHQLSIGMRQRVALARLIIEDHSLILLDEPFSALDTETRAEMQDLSLKAFAGKTVILVTHDPQEAMRLGNQVLLLTGSPARLVSYIQG